jgi:TPR repeat protein
MVLDGLGGPVDFQRGVQLVEGGCHGASGEAVGRACLRYAEMLLDGRLPLNEKDAHDYAAVGCNQGNGKACALEGKLLSEGRGVPNANPIDGAGLIKRGCELGDAKACIDYSHTGQGWIEQNRATTP